MRCANAEAAIDRLAIHEAISAVADFVERGQRLPHRAGALAGREGRLGRGSGPARHHPVRGGRVTARDRRPAQPVMPKASALLWEALGADALGALADQRISDAGRWGQLPAGARLTKGAALFPRLAEEDA